jgi:hypothetical protein
MKYAAEIGGFMCLDIHDEFRKDWFRQSEVQRGYTDTQTAW